MRIYYYLSEYISHKKAGIAYINCLKSLGHEIVQDANESDVIIIHEAPEFYSQIIESLKINRNKPIIGYGVWETDRLPNAYINGLDFIDEIWTCSDFSLKAFSPYIKTKCLPHVVEKPKISKDALETMTKRLNLGENDFAFYTIVDSINPRKNLKTLLAAFSVAFANDKNTKLVVKQYRNSIDLSSCPFVIDISEYLDDEYIAALSSICNAFVSAHHAEAWGLGLSEAMILGKPVVATGYSGNMQFMNDKNSFPVSFTLSNIGEDMCNAMPNLYNKDMCWADINISDLVKKLRYVRKFIPDLQFKINLANDMKNFSEKVISKLIQKLFLSVEKLNQNS